MQTSIIVYGLLLLGLIFVYVLRKRTRQGLTGTDWFGRWFGRMGLQTRSGPERADVPSRAVTGDSPDVEAILDDIYREFSAEAETLRAQASAMREALEEQFGREVRHLRDELSALRLEVLRLSSVQAAAASGPADHRDARPLTVEPAASAPVAPSLQSVTHYAVASDAVIPEGDGMERFHPKYFRILEALQQGKSAVDVARELGLGVHEVQLVLQVMSSP